MVYTKEQAINVALRMLGDRVNSDNSFAGVNVNLVRELLVCETRFLKLRMAKKGFFEVLMKECLDELSDTKDKVYSRNCVDSITNQLFSEWKLSDGCEKVFHVTLTVVPLIVSTIISIFK